MIFETSGSNDEHDQEKLNNFLSKAMEKSYVVDGVTTNEPSKIQNLWQVRERIAESLLKAGYCYKYDLSLPLSHFYEIVPAVRERVGDLATIVCGYGHVGDSNIHLTVVADEFSDELYKRIEPFVFEYTSKVNGSVSAEHGIGFHKTKYLHYSKSSEAIDFMRHLKSTMDPNGILNPYKVLPL
jgi:FAD/FMN-containing dehydrogenase